MARGMMRGQAILALMLLAAATTACGQFGNLKARKHLKDANALYAQADYRQAAVEYEEAIKSDPDMIQAYFYLGNSYDNMYKPARKGESENDGLLPKAVKNYEIAVQRETDQGRKKLALQYLAASYGADKLNDPAKAEPVVRQMIQMDPKDTGSYYGLSKIYEDAGRFEEAEAALLQARDAVPSNPEVYLQLAGFYNKRDQFEKAVAMHEERAKLDPNNPEAFWTLAAFYENAARKDYRLSATVKKQYIERGIVAADKALAIKQDFVEAITYKNLLLRLQANVEKDPARQQQLLREADRLRDQAQELRKKQQAGAAAGQ
jgi:tetratricopeptide (TPR) repeat protein